MNKEIKKQLQELKKQCENNYDFTNALEEVLTTQEKDGLYYSAHEFYCGVEIPEEEAESGYISYSTLAKMFDAVLCNNITDDENIYEEYSEAFAERRRETLENETTEELQEKLENYTSLDILRDKEDREELIDELLAQESYSQEVFQYFIVEDFAKEIIEAFTDDIVFYNNTLDCYIWCITHFGTSWRGVPVDYTLEEARGR